MLKELLIGERHKNFVNYLYAVTIKKYLRQKCQVFLSDQTRSPEG